PHPLSLHDALPICNPRSDAKTNRERQRDDAYRYARGQIGEKSPPIVIAQTLDQFWFKKLHCSRSPVCHSERSRGISNCFFVAQPSWLWGQRASCPLKKGQTSRDRN